MSSGPFGEKIVDRITDSAGTAQLADHRGRVEIDAEDTDRLGVLVREIRISGVKARHERNVLRRRLKKLEKSVDYLPEGLVLVEHDPARTGALMRSDRPREVGGQRHYFELRVEKNLDARFGRFRQPPGAADRHPVSTLLDRRTLARLVDDLLAAVAE